MIRDRLSQDVREGRNGNPGWRWRWWVCDETEIPTVDEIRDLTLTSWGNNLLMSVEGSNVFKYHGVEPSIDTLADQITPAGIDRVKFVGESVFRFSSPRSGIWCLVWLYFLKQIGVRVDYMNRRLARHSDPPRSA